MEKWQFTSILYMHVKCNEKYFFLKKKVFLKGVFIDRDSVCQFERKSFIVIVLPTLCTEEKSLWSVVKDLSTSNI